MEKREGQTQYEQEREDEYTVLFLGTKQEKYSAKTQDLT
jgi:hypothetical protein